MRKLLLKPEQAGDCAILERAGTLVVIDADGECWKQRQQSLLLKIAHGAAGLAKATLRIDRASTEAIEERRKVCSGCPEFMPAGIASKCRACGCNLMAKTTIASERCPLGKWASVSVAD